jgi:hypothetical protein
MYRINPVSSPKEPHLFSHAIGTLELLQLVLEVKDWIFTRSCLLHGRNGTRHATDVGMLVDKTVRGSIQSKEIKVSQDKADAEAAPC